MFFTVLSLVSTSICEYFGATEDLTVDCKVTCVSDVFVFLGVVRFG